MISGKSGWFLREISFVCLGGWKGAPSWFWLMASPKRHKKLLRRKSSARRTERKNMKTEKLDDLDRYVADRMKRDPKFADAYEEERREWELGQVLAKARERAGLTQEALARKIGTTRSAVCRYERQPTNLTLSTLEKVARAMGRKLVVKLA